MKQNIKNFKKYKFLLEQLVVKEIKLKYRSSVLGVLWTLLEPLLTMLVLTFVFGVFFNKKMEYVPVYILSGRLVYTFFANSTLATTIANYIIFGISLSILIVIGIVIKVPFTWRIFLSLIPLGLLFVMVLGIGFILATMSVFFRDLEYLWGVACMIIMYTAAIFYDTEKVIKAGKGWVFKINPLYSIIANFRDCIYGRPMEQYYLVFSILFSFGSLIVGAFIFYKKQDKFILNI